MDTQTIFSKLPKWKYSGLILGLIAVLSVLILSFIGISSLLDEYIYDPILGFSVSLRDQPSHVLIVYDDNPGKRAADDYVLLLEKLEIFEPEGIVFNFTPQFKDDLFFSKAGTFDNIIFGRRLIADVNDQQRFSLETVPDSANNFPFGIVHIPPWEKGVFRRQYSHFSVDGNIYPALEIACLDSNLPMTSRVMKEDSYRIYFHGPSGSLPNVSFDQVISDQLINEMVANRIVLISAQSEGVEFEYPTPTTVNSPKMPLVEYQGHALNSLLSNHPIFEINPWIHYIVLIIVICICSFVYQMSGANLIILFTVCMMAAYTLMGFALLHIFHYWCAVNEFILAQLLLLIMIKNRKLQIIGQALETITVSLSARTQQFFEPENFYTSPEYWSQILGIINNMLNLDRVILLDRRKNAFHLKEIISFQCGLEDIKELRRDIRREPYNTAIQEKGPIRLENYLRNPKPDELQYIFPLIFGGEVYGFGALSVAKDKTGDIKDFENILAAYGEQIGRLLYDYNIVKDLNARPSLLSRLITYEHFQTTLEGVRQLTSFLHDRSVKLYKLHNQLQGAFVIFDLFGRVYMVNNSMQEILTSAKITSFKLSALDIIAEISQFDLLQTRKMFRNVVLDRQQISFTINAPNKRNYRLILRPLESDSNVLSPDVAIFGLWGILMELIDTTDQDNYFQLKGLLSMELGNKLRNSLSAIQITAQMMCDSDSTPVDRAKMMLNIQTRIDDVVRLLQTSEKYLETELDYGEINRFPVNALPVLDAALADFQAKIDQRKIRFNVEKPMVMNFVYASQRHLQPFFEIILEMLLDDASDDSEIIIQVDEDDREIHFLFSNSGYGIPNEQIQEYMKEDSASHSEKNKNMREALSWVEFWGGRMAVSSDVGVGTRVKVSLESFI